MAMVVPPRRSYEPLMGFAQLTGQLIMRTGSRPNMCLTSSTRLRPAGIESSHDRLEPIGDVVAVDDPDREAPGPRRGALSPPRLSHGLREGACADAGWSPR
jgi:hypothetical protein